jgi:hypothetical protein
MQGGPVPAEVQRLRLKRAGPEIGPRVQISWDYRGKRIRSGRLIGLGSPLVALGGGVEAVAKLSMCQLAAFGVGEFAGLGL